MVLAGDDSLLDHGIIRTRPNTDIATGLFLPTGMTFGPDGNIYVSNIGFGPPPVGLGQVVKITLPADN